MKTSSGGGEKKAKNTDRQLIEKQMQMKYMNCVVMLVNRN